MPRPVQLITTTHIGGGPGSEFGGFAFPAVTALAEAGFWTELRQRGLVPDAPVPVTLPPGTVVAEDRIGTLGRIGLATAERLAEGLGAGARTLLVGGACHAAVGAVAALQRTYGATTRLGVVWFDAHGDFNTPGTTITGRLGGMPVAVIAGLAHPDWRATAGQVVPVPTDRIVIADARNLDPRERELIAATDATVVPLDASLAGLRTALARLARDCDRLYLHIDVDVLDAALVPSAPTAEPDGPDLDRVIQAAGLALATGLVDLLAIVSIDPSGPGGEISLASSRTLISRCLELWPAEGAPTGVA